MSEELAAADATGSGEPGFVVRAPNTTVTTAVTEVSPGVPRAVVSRPLLAGGGHTVARRPVWGDAPFDGVECVVRRGKRNVHAVTILQGYFFISFVPS